MISPVLLVIFCTCALFITKFVVAICVVLVPIAAVGASGTPVKDGELIGAPQAGPAGPSGPISP